MGRENIVISSPDTVPPPVKVLSEEDELRQIELELKRFQLHEAKKQNEAAKNAAEQQRRMAESMAKDTISTLVKEKQKQARCGHRNDRGESDTVAFKDYSNRLNMMCQSCYKTWIEGVDDPFPVHLIHKTRQIGSFGSE